MKYLKTKTEALVITPKHFYDYRGYFFESFNAPFFSELNLPTDYPRENSTLSMKNCLRGLYIDDSHKVFHVLQGRVFLVIVNFERQTQDSFILSEKKKQIIYIPPKCAYGIYTLSTISRTSIKFSEPFDKDGERSILWKDDKLSIKWPLVEPHPILSTKDAQALPIQELEE